MEIYSIKNITFSYPQSEAPVLQEISLNIQQGEYITLCGCSGCGKTTLLRHLKPNLAPHGTIIGEIFFKNVLIDTISHKEQSSDIGFVMQNPDNQIVTDKVWHELAFGLESLGIDNKTIRRRVAEMASFFGIQGWFHKNVFELSGGQKQLLNLASVMAMQPSVLILDEPTAQLDPIAATEFLDTVGKINRELGITVLLTEHRLEEAFSHSNRVLVMDKGKIIADGTAVEVGMTLKGHADFCNVSGEHNMFAAMPAPMRIYAATKSSDPCPVSVCDGRRWMSNIRISDCKLQINDKINKKTKQNRIPAIELDEIWFKYEKNLPDILRGLSFKIYHGEICAILGGNGTGKTTTLLLISGINKAYSGKIKINGKLLNSIPDLFDGLLGVLPQNPQALFVKKTVEADLFEMLQSNAPKHEKQERVRAVSALCGLDSLLQSHPYDLSGGEQQRAALAKILLLRPRILLLDEPTKGLDAHFKKRLALILRSLAKEGVTILMVSHDIEFCAEYTDRCAMFFNGTVVSEGTPHDFFTGNSFYTTSANRMARHLLPEAITANDVITAINGYPPPNGTTDTEIKIDASQIYTELTPPSVINTSIKLSLWRKIVAAGAILSTFALLLFAFINRESFSSFISGGDISTTLTDTADVLKYILLIFSIVICSIIAVWAFNPIGFETEIQVPKNKRNLSKRTIIATIMILLFIPLTIYIGIYFFADRKYYFITLLVLIETMLPFAFVFEKRKPQPRELIVIAVLCAIAVAGRAAFFMLPQFKPVVAIVIIAGVAFGGEAGFLTGAMTGFVSNTFFGQGPWTPWQMFAFGIIGFLAGVLFKKGLLRLKRISLCIFGGISTFFIYGGIMNSASVLMFQGSPTKEMFFTAYLQGIPFDLVHAAASVVFLAIFARPMLEKLDRIKVKYGLIE